ncbi:MAG: class I mannose-6-phosphate isomerase [Ktedonobacteraceae bacterium]
MVVSYVYPIRLEASLHETIWGGRKLERDGWKQLPDGDVAIGEAWETEITTLVQNGSRKGETLGTLVDEWGPSLLGEQVVAIFGLRFPLLAKFIDANANLSVQVHPEDTYAAQRESGKLGKTEFWYILAAEPGAKVVYGFEHDTHRSEVQSAIEQATLETLLHEEPVFAGDVVFVPAGIVHAICCGVMLYELQEYSDITYRMYDYGRLTASGKPRELHIERSLDVSQYKAAHHVKTKPVMLPGDSGYEERCLVACRYFITRELLLKEGACVQRNTPGSCVILSSLGAEIRVSYGNAFAYCETLSRGQTMIIPAALGTYRIEGSGVLLLSYVPSLDDAAWSAWQSMNSNRDT